MLVVEDHDFQRRTALTLLRGLGVGALHEAADGTSALALLEVSEAPGRHRLRHKTSACGERAAASSSSRRGRRCFTIEGARLTRQIGYESQTDALRAVGLAG